jgi:hypothetical protein
MALLSTSAESFGRDPLKGGGLLSNGLTMDDGNIIFSNVRAGFKPVFLIRRSAETYHQWWRSS